MTSKTVVVRSEAPLDALASDRLARPRVPQLAVGVPDATHLGESQDHCTHEFFRNNLDRRGFALIEAV